MAFYIYLDFRRQDFLSQIISKNLILRDFSLQFLFPTNWSHLFQSGGGGKYNDKNIFDDSY